MILIVRYLIHVDCRAVRMKVVRNLHCTLYCIHLSKLTCFIIVSFSWSKVAALSVISARSSSPDLFLGLMPLLMSVMAIPGHSLTWK